jgi:hypothetical protein
MATDHQHHSSHGEDGAAPLNHETTDISLEGVGKLTVGFVAILLVVSAAMYGTYRLIDRRMTAADTSMPRRERAHGVVDIAKVPLMDAAPNMIAAGGREPAGPRILTNEPLWLRDIRTHELNVLTTYGWVNKEAGVVRLPIERAKQLILEAGLPATTAPAEAAEPASSAPAPAAAAAAKQ